MQDGQMLFDARTTWNKQEGMDEVILALIDSGQIQAILVGGLNNAPVRYLNTPL